LSYVAHNNYTGLILFWAQGGKKERAGRRIRNPNARPGYIGVHLLLTFRIMHNGLPFKIVIAEDDADDRMFIDQAFLEIGYDAEVKKFKDGKALLEYLQHIEVALYPSLIVLDSSLHGMEVLEVLVLLKSSPSYGSIPVVIYCSMLPDHKKRQLLDAGAQACIEKVGTVGELNGLAQRLKHLAEAGQVKT
jgi:CheY-like chemotaxis protein